VLSFTLQVPFPWERAAFIVEYEGARRPESDIVEPILQREDLRVTQWSRYSREKT
jgi:hypothetical protein